MDLTPHQLKLIATLKTGPWPVGLAEMADDGFHDLCQRTPALAVVKDHPIKGPMADLTEAGWAHRGQNT